MLRHTRGVLAQQASRWLWNWSFNPLNILLFGLCVEGSVYVISTHCPPNQTSCKMDVPPLLFFEELKQTSVTFMLSEERWLNELELGPESLFESESTGSCFCTRNDYFLYKLCEVWCRVICILLHLQHSQLKLLQLLEQSSFIRFSVLSHQNHEKGERHNVNTQQSQRKNRSQRPWR